MSSTTSTEALVRDALARTGWTTADLGEGLYRAEGVGRLRRNLMIRIDPAGYVAAAIVPVTASPRDNKKAAKLYARLLELNHRILMARFSIDDDLDVILSVEHPAGDLDPVELGAALDLLEHYSDAHLEEILALSC